MELMEIATLCMKISIICFIMHKQIELILKIERYRDFIEDVTDNQEDAKMTIYGIEKGYYEKYKNEKEDEE